MLQHVRGIQRPDNVIIVYVITGDLHEKHSTASYFNTCRTRFWRLSTHCEVPKPDTGTPPTQRLAGTEPDGRMHGGTDGRAGRRTERPTGTEPDRRTHGGTDGRVDRQTGGQRDRLELSQTDARTEGQTGGQAGGQADRETDWN